jgi:imidazoleglycerol-phosphate dehydratase
MNPEEPSRAPCPEHNGIWLHVEGEEDTTIRPANPEWIRQMKTELADWPDDAPKTAAKPAAQTPAATPRPGDANGSTTVVNAFRSQRAGQIQRHTAETRIRVQLNLDGTGQATAATGVGFFDHMLTLLAKHSLIDLTVEATGDLHVDAHHTVEDVGICFGKALVQALGDKSGIRRYGSATLPMDEVLVTAAVDLSGRPFCVWQADLPPELLGTFNAPLAEEFWRAVSASGLCNLHVLCHHGKNAHHIVKAIFKACARALRQAVEMDPRMPGIPSTKGVL